MTAAATVRVDSWLWAVRVYKTRSAATTACRAGHVRVNGEKVKAAQAIRIGDEVRVRIAGFDRILVARQLIVKRVGAPLAALAADDITPERPKPEHTAVFAQRDRGAGRPTKRERRDIDKLRARDDEPEPWRTRHRPRATNSPRDRHHSPMSPLSHATP